MGALVKTTESSQEPVTTADLKSHMRVDSSDDDTLIAALGKAARLMVADLTGRALTVETWEWTLDRFPSCDYLLLPVAPLVSVSSLVTTDSDGATATWDSVSYLVDAKGEPGRLVKKTGYEWPIPNAGLRDANGIALTFVAGYGAASPIVVPEPIKLAIKMLAAHWYENREAVQPQDLKEVPVAVGALLAPFRAWNQFSHARVYEDQRFPWRPA